jgi:hypothetical protein
MNRFRPVDFIIFGLIAIILPWEAIKYGELADLQRMVRFMQMGNQ